MAKLKSLTIKKFRGFDHLEIDGFSRINLFLGKNNSGKTSVLEAIFMLMGMSNSSIPVGLNGLRGLKVDSPEQLKYLFHKLNYENKPDIVGEFDDDTKRYLEIAPVYQQSLDATDVSSTNLSKTTNRIKGLDLIFSSNAGQKYVSSLIFENNKFEYQLSQDYKEELKLSFISSINKGQQALQDFSEIVKRKGSDSVLKLLRLFDDRIQDVKPLSDGIYFDMKGIDELVPINIMGDGIRRFMGIVTTMSVAKSSVLLIDEIENGMHFSAHKLLWKGLLALAEQRDIQLFVTTHNLEALTSLKAVLEEETSASMHNSVCAFTISETANAGFKAYRYSSEAFGDAIDHEMELRS